MGYVPEGCPLCGREGLLRAGIWGKAGAQERASLFKGLSFKMVFPLHLFKNKKFLTKCQLRVRFHLSL